MSRPREARARRRPSLYYLNGERRPNDQDPRIWRQKYAAIGGIPEGPWNNFQAAVLFYGPDIDLRAIEDVAKHALGNEASQPVVEWARRLRLAQVRHTGTGWELGLPSPDFSADLIR